jgi:hypothetical protein
MKTYAAICLLLMWLVIGTEPGFAAPWSEMQLACASEIGHRHCMLHEIARAFAWAAVPGMVLAWGILANLRRRENEAARRGGCLRAEREKTSAVVKAAIAASLAPAAVFLLMVWVLDAGIGWQCSLAPAVDFADERAKALGMAVVAGVAGVTAWRLAAKRLRNTAQSALRTMSRRKTDMRAAIEITTTKTDSGATTIRVRKR